MKRLALISAFGLVSVVAVIALTRSDEPETTETTTSIDKLPTQVPAPVPKRFGEMTTDQRTQLRKEFGEKFQACLNTRLQSNPAADESAVRESCLTDVRRDLGMID